MDRDATRSTIRRKLNKSQVIDILERNVALYREEENFVHYLVELAFYLIECEYDWSESKANPTKSGITAAIETPIPPDIESHNTSRSLPRRITTESILAARRTCPFCGSVVGEQVTCPSCRNITK